MSRRRHGRSQHHGQVPAAGPRPATAPRPGPTSGPETSANGAVVASTQRPQGPAPSRGPESAPQNRPVPTVAPSPADVAASATTRSAATTGSAATQAALVQSAPAVASASAPGPFSGGPDRNAQCTAPQLRRFIKSRPYVPMHELRRRFGIDGGDDDVTPVRLEPGWVYVGLPAREGTLLGELLRAGEIGYELSLDPRSPIVIGVYPMRPITRN